MKRKFIVESGLTRRLVVAETPRAARVKYLQKVPMHGNKLKVPYDAIRVFEATEDALAEFRKGKKAHFDNQLALDLGRAAPALVP